MLGNLQNFFENLTTVDTATSSPERDVELAAAALLIHCARADGHRSDAEDVKLREILVHGYEATPAEVDELIERATVNEAAAIDVHAFTRVLHRNLDRDGRLRVVRQLWEISHADDKIDHDERSIVSLVAGLLDIEVADAVALRHNVTHPSST